MKTRAPRFTIETARNAGLAVALLVATAILLASVHKHYPVQHWLFWRYAGYWLAVLAWSLSCLAVGHVSLRWVLGRSLPWLEHLAVAFGLGVFVFELLLFLAGLARLYGPVLFVGLPVLLLASCGWPLWRYMRRACRHLRARGVYMRGPTPFGWVVIGFGFAWLIALYLPSLAPTNSSYDTRWRHMMMADQYAAYGGIRRFPEGWVFAGSPQFTPLLYTWAFMLPVGRLFDRVELCAHLEYVTFLWITLLGIPALVRRLVPRANPATVWAARFLFPGVFLYDSNLSVGTDHIGAVFAAPLFLVGLRAWRSMTIRSGALLGALIAAAILAKETTALLLAPAPIVLVIVRFAVDLVQRLRRRTRSSARLWAAIGAGVVTIALTTPHWLKNLIWYGNPIYPNLHQHFANRPWDPDMGYVFEWSFLALLWAAPRNMQGLLEALSTQVTFSFLPHAWFEMHGNVPVFGSLFTLMLLTLPFLRGTRRIWALCGFVQLAIFAWFWIHHEDRHLQALVPWMAAVVVALSILVWRTRDVVLRICVCALIGSQVVWGADIYFYPTFFATSPKVPTTPLSVAMDLLGQGYKGEYDQRFAFQEAQQAVGARIPRNAVLLAHERRDQLGFGRTTVTDFYADQYAINYTRLGGPGQIFHGLRQLGITHLTWLDQTSRSYQPLAGDIVFFEFAHRYTRHRRRVGGYWLASMPTKPPPMQPASSRKVGVLGCRPEYTEGVYLLSDLSVPRFGPLKTHFPRPRAMLDLDDEWADDVFAIAIDTDCKVKLAWRVRRQFERVAKREREWGRSHEIWLRKP